MMLSINSTPKQQLNLDSRTSLQTSKAYLNRRNNVMNKSNRITHILDKLIEYPISTRIKSKLSESQSYSFDKKRYLNHALLGNETPNLDKDIIHFTFSPQERERNSSSNVRLSDEEDIEWDNFILNPKTMDNSFEGKNTPSGDSKPTRSISVPKRRRIILIRRLIENEEEKTVADQEIQTDFPHSYKHLLPRSYDKVRYFTPKKIQNTDKLKAISRFPSFEHHVNLNQQKHWKGRALFADKEKLGSDGFRKMWQDKLNQTKVIKPVRKVNSKRLVINGNSIYS